MQSRRKHLESLRNTDVLRVSVRGGVTLTEVLMSLMIMSIGVSLVATLFPIAALRSAQATKMTNGAIVKKNVEALVRTRPQFIFDPDGDFVNSSPVSAGYWSRITEHFRSREERNYIVDPAGYLAVAGNVDSSLPRPSVLGPVGTIPGGVNAVPSNARGVADYFGNVSATAGGAYPVLPRYDGGLQSRKLTDGSALALNAATLRDFELLASDLANLGDGWDVVLDEPAEAFINSSGAVVSTLPTSGAMPTIVGVQLSDELDLSAIVTSRMYVSGLSIADPELTRVTIFREDDKISQSFPLTAISGSSCLWTEAAVGSVPAADYNANSQLDVRPLPIEFYGSAPARVLIGQKRTQDFNWLLTVRRGTDGRARGVDLVVLFNNGRKPVHERVFPAAFSKGAFGVVVDKVSGVDSTGDPAEPNTKRGSWVLDVENAHWYRISKVEDFSATQYLVTMETAASADSPTGGGGAIFMPAVVDVYPLGDFELPQSMTPPTF